MAQNPKKPIVEIIPNTDLINLDFRSIIATEIHRLKDIATTTALSNEEHQNLKSLASTYKCVEGEAREQEQSNSLHRLSHEELLQLALKVVNSLPEAERKDLILALVTQNQELLT